MGLNLCFFFATKINFDIKIAILIFDPLKFTLIVQIRHSASFGFLLSASASASASTNSSGLKFVL